jgi:hypothetical protein
MGREASPSAAVLDSQWQVENALAKVPLVRMETVKRSDDMKGFVVLPRRWAVERTFSWFGRNRRLAKDFENLAETLATFVTLVSIQLALRRLARAWFVNSTNRRLAMHDNDGRQIGSRRDLRRGVRQRRGCAESCHSLTLPRNPRMICTFVGAAATALGHLFCEASRSSKTRLRSTPQA